MRDVKPEMRKWLGLGKEGSGKTAFIDTLPRPCFVFSFDKGYTTIAGADGIRVAICMDENRYKPHAYKDFVKRFGLLQAGEMYKWEDGREEPYKTIVFDNLTFFADLMMDDIQAASGTVDKAPGFDGWKMVKNKMRDILSQSLLLSEYVYATALLKYEQDKNTSEMFILPNMDGSIRNEICAWFDFVGYFEVDKGSDGKKNHKLVTVGDRRYKARARIPKEFGNVILAVEEPDFKVINDKVMKAFEGKKGGG